MAVDEKEEDMTRRVGSKVIDDIGEMMSSMFPAGGEPVVRGKRTNTRDKLGKGKIWKSRDEKSRKQRFRSDSASAIVSEAD